MPIKLRFHEKQFKIKVSVSKGIFSHSTRSSKLPKRLIHANEKEIK